MDRVGGSLAQHAVVGAIPVARESVADGRRACLEGSMPVASSLHWRPVGATAAAQADAAAFPTFITQGVLAAIHDHIAAGAGAASLGFLSGGLFREPDGGARYVVIESTLALPWRVAGDRTKLVVLDGFTHVRKELRKDGRQLLGWYHSHLFRDARLSADDVDTHETFFDQPWQVALVVVPGDEPLGGLFRTSAGAGWSSAPLPFYELLDDAALLPDGRKVTDLAWGNYRAAEPAMPSRGGPRDRLPSPPSPPLLLFPDEPEQTPSPAAAPHAMEGRGERGQGRVARFAAYGVVGVLAAAGLVNLSQAMASRWSARPLAGASAPQPFYELLDDAALLPDGRKVTDLAWGNYRAADPAMPSWGGPRDRLSPSPPLLLFPDELEETLSPAAAPRATGGRGLGRVARFAAYGVVGVLAAAGLVNLSQVMVSRWSARGPAGAPATTSLAALDRVDRAADTLALAVAAFDVRARLFERRQMACPELSRGLVEMEERWIAYNAARKSAFVLDSARAVRDRSAYADVTAVEQRFERSQCARP